MDDDRHALALIQPYLDTSAEISLDEQISEALVNKLGKLSYEEQLTIVLCSRYTPQHFPELASIAEKLGTNVNELIKSYTTVAITSGFKVPSVVFRKVFSEIEKNIIQSKKPHIIWWPLLHVSRALDRQATQQGLQLLHMLVAQLPQQRAILKDALYLFVKLLSSDTTSLLLAPAILSYLADEKDLQNLKIWRIVDTLLQCPKEHLEQLVNFTIHEDPKVQQGAITLWATLLETKRFLVLKASRPYCNTFTSIGSSIYLS